MFTRLTDASMSDQRLTFLGASGRFSTTANPGWLKRMAGTRCSSNTQAHIVGSASTYISMGALERDIVNCLFFRSSPSNAKEESIKSS